MEKHQCSKCHYECSDEDLYPVEIQEWGKTYIIYMCLPCIYEWYEGN